MHTQIELAAILIGVDEQMLEAFVPTLQGLQISWATFPDFQSATSSLSTAKFDAIILNTAAVPFSAEVLTTLRTMPSTGKAVVIALADGFPAMYAAFDNGSNFVLQPPLNSANVFRTLWAAYGLMLRGRQQYFRHGLSFPVTISLADTLMTAKTMNVSESGLALECPSPLTPGEMVGLTFAWPKAAHQIRATARVIWADSHGKAGLRFEVLQTEDKRLLESELTSRFLERWNDEAAAEFIRNMREATSQEAEVAVWTDTGLPAENPRLIAAAERLGETSAFRK